MRRSFILVLSAALWASAAAGDQVTLKNGDRLTGAIVSSDSKTLLMKTEFAGDVTIQWDAIVGIESAETLNLTMKDGTKLSGKITTVDGKLVVAGAAASATTSEPKEAVVAVRNETEQKAYDLAQERMAHPKFTYFWSGLFDTGLALTRGNSSTASYTFNAKGVRETPRDKLTIYANYVFANSDTTPPSETTANMFQAGIRGDLNISPRTFVYAFGDFQTNALQHLDLRQVYGGGIGYHVIKTDRTVFDVFAGGDFDRDEFSTYTYTNPAPPPPLLTMLAYDQNSAEVNAGETLNMHLSKRSVLGEDFTIYPNLSHTGQYRFQFDTTLAVQMKNWLSWQTTFSDRYISYPPAGLKGNDLLLSTGFRVTWGPSKL